jgi:hypothetical protein
MLGIEQPDHTFDGFDVDSQRLQSALHAVTLRDEVGPLLGQRRDRWIRLHGCILLKVALVENVT